MCINVQVVGINALVYCVNIKEHQLSLQEMLQPSDISEEECMGWTQWVAACRSKF